MTRKRAYVVMRSNLNYYREREGRDPVCPLCGDPIKRGETVINSRFKNRFTRETVDKRLTRVLIHSVCAKERGLL